MFEYIGEIIEQNIWEKVAVKSRANKIIIDV